MCFMFTKNICQTLPPKAVPIPVAAAESNVNCGMASEAIPNVAVPAKINPDEIFFSLNS